MALFFCIDRTKWDESYIRICPQEKNSCPVNVIDMDRRDMPCEIALIVNHIASVLHDAYHILRTAMVIRNTFDIYPNPMSFGIVQLIQKTDSRFHIHSSIIFQTKKKIYP